MNLFVREWSARRLRTQVINNIIDVMIGLRVSHAVAVAGEKSTSQYNELLKTVCVSTVWLDA
jgi:hypothetical protein